MPPLLRRATLDESITTLCSALGGCERIFKTPIPLSYTRHTSRVLVLWLTVLPFCVSPSRYTAWHAGSTDACMPLQLALLVD